MNDWIVRRGGAEDADAIVGTFLRSYARSSVGMRAGAHRSGRDRMADGDAFWEDHRPIGTALLATDLTVLADAQDPQPGGGVWGWVASSGSTIHYVLVKRSLSDAGLGGEALRAMLGAALDEPRAYTLQQTCLHEMKATPKRWYPDFTWWRIHASLV